MPAGDGFCAAYDPRAHIVDLPSINILPRQTREGMLVNKERWARC